MTPEEINRQRRIVTDSLCGFLQSPAGKGVIELLEAEFNCDQLKTNDPHETYYLLGCHAVLTTLKKLAEIK